MSKVWIHRDKATGEMDICTEWTDAMGPDFHEADLPNGFVSDFVTTQLAYYQYQDYLEVAWIANDDKDKIPAQD